MAASGFLVAGFMVLPLAMGLALVAGVAAAGRGREAPEVTRRWTLVTALVTALWMKATWLAAASGLIRRFDATPPPLALLLLTITALGPAIALSPLGGRLVRGLSLATLVGVQAFRLPLELLMHRAYEEGIMPVQMSYSGLNLDILTGISAAVLGLALARWTVPRWVVWAWSAGGLLLLWNVVIVAVLGTPIFRWFGDEHLNTWVADPPFVWLPAVLVLSAWAGHLLVIRKLRQERAGVARPGLPAAALTR